MGSFFRLSSLLSRQLKQRQWLPLPSLSLSLSTLCISAKTATMAHLSISLSLSTSCIAGTCSSTVLNMHRGGNEETKKTLYNSKTAWCSSLMYLFQGKYTQRENFLYTQHSKKEMFGKFVNKCLGGDNQVNAIMKSFHSPFMCF